MAGNRLLVLCGVVGPILFTFLIGFESLLRPAYSQVYNQVSDLGVGPFSVIQNSNFVIFGLLSICFALGLLQGLPDPSRRSTKWAVRLVALFGIGIFFAGVFPENYISGGPHDFASFTAFFSIIAAQLLVWRGLQKANRRVWGRYRMYSLASGLLTIIAFFVAISSFGNAYPGATQKAFIAVWLIWIEATALRISRDES